MVKPRGTRRRSAAALGCATLAALALTSASATARKHPKGTSCANPLVNTYRPPTALPVLGKDGLVQPRSLGVWGGSRSQPPQLGIVDGAAGGVLGVRWPSGVGLGGQYTFCRASGKDSDGTRWTDGDIHGGAHTRRVSCRSAWQLTNPPYGPYVIVPKGPDEFVFYGTGLPTAGADVPTGPRPRDGRAYCTGPHVLRARVAYVRARDPARDGLRPAAPCQHALDETVGADRPTPWWLTATTSRATKTLHWKSTPAWQVCRVQVRLLNGHRYTSRSPTGSLTFPSLPLNNTADAVLAQLAYESIQVIHRTR